MTEFLELKYRSAQSISVDLYRRRIMEYRLFLGLDLRLPQIRQFHAEAINPIRCNPEPARLPSIPLAGQ
jgi:hypothetical protein